jgi:anti-sigma B factor antagonist
MSSNSIGFHLACQSISNSRLRHLFRCFRRASFVRMPGMSTVPFQLTSRAGSNSDIQILHVKGAINQSTSGQFQDAVAAASVPCLIIDLTDMSSVDSMAVGALVRAFVSCNKARRKLAFVGMNYRVSNVLQITGVAPLFDTFATVAEAETAFANS